MPLTLGAPGGVRSKYFEGRGRRSQARAIQAIFSIGFTLTLGGLLYGLFGDQENIHHENPSKEEQEADTHVINAATISGLVFNALGAVWFGVCWLGKGWRTAEDWGYIDIVL